MVRNSTSGLYRKFYLLLSKKTTFGFHIFIKLMKLYLIKKKHKYINAYNIARVFKYKRNFKWHLPSAGWCMNETKTTITGRQSFHLVKVETLFLAFSKSFLISCKTSWKASTVVGFWLAIHSWIERHWFWSFWIRLEVRYISHISFRNRFNVKQRRPFDNFFNFL